MKSMRWIFLLVLFCVQYSLYGTTYFVGGVGASDGNSGSADKPFATIQKAATVAKAGDIVTIRSGTYRETISPANRGTAERPIVFQAAAGAKVVISGLETVRGEWNIFKGNIYKTDIALPVDGHQSKIISNTTILSNQIFNNGEMQFEARWPKVASMDDLFDRSKLRFVDNMQAFTSTYLTDEQLPDIGESYGGAKLWINGWYVTETRTVISQEGKTLNYLPYSDNGDAGKKRRRYYYVTGKLGLLTSEKEWHYESGILYYWQPGGGKPTNIEFKARNWGFDLRGTSHITIAGLEFVGCEINGDTESEHITIDNVKMSYQNHTFLQEGRDVIFHNPRQTGIKLIGPNSIIRNSEIKYVASNAIWLGTNCTAENNLIHHVNYEGSYGAPFILYDTASGVKILRNTCFTTGRSSLDFGYVENGFHLNCEVAFNDFSDFGRLNVDLGAIYGARKINTHGTVIHHNWLYNSATGELPPELGTSAGMYLDQGFGPIVFHHNVEWNNVMIGYFTHPNYNGRVMPDRSYLYNNVFATAAPGSGARHSYKCGGKVPDKIDVQRNNIYRNSLIVSLNAAQADVSHAVFGGVDPLFTGVGKGGLKYRVKKGSAAINAGTVIPGITNETIGAPDIGAYEFGGKDWTPGYVPKPYKPIEASIRQSGN